MKRIIFVLVTSLVLLSCKNEKEPVIEEAVTATTTAERNPICDELTNIQDQEELQIWINNHQTELCDGTLFECVLKQHNVNFKEFYKMINDYWKGKEPDFKSFTWLEIKNKIENKCYPDYLGFFVDSNKKITDLKIMTKFTTSETCYSIPLFRAIDKHNNGLKDSDEFVFTRGIVNGQEKIIFYIENKVSKIVEFYDISDNPTIYEFDKKVKR